MSEQNGSANSNDAFVLDPVQLPNSTLSLSWQHILEELRALLEHSAAFRPQDLPIGMIVIIKLRKGA